MKIKKKSFFEGGGVRSGIGVGEVGVARFGVGG